MLFDEHPESIHRGRHPQLAMPTSSTINPGRYWAWLPPTWHPAARAWRRSRGPILATDAFARALERKRPKAPSRRGKHTTKEVTP